jgi:hypothetical protein
MRSFVRRLRRLEMNSGVGRPGIKETMLFYETDAERKRFDTTTGEEIDAGRWQKASLRIECGSVLSAEEQAAEDAVAIANGRLEICDSEPARTDETAGALQDSPEPSCDVSDDAEIDFSETGNHDG